MSKRPKTQKPTELKPFTMLPPAKGKCQVCAADHTPDMPHNRDSLYYQMAFKQAHGRWPTWADALAHCTPEVQKEWTVHLTAHELMGDG